MTNKRPKVHISWWLIIVEALLVRYVRVSNEWIEQVRRAASKGPVVFILRNRSLIDFLCVRGLCHRHGLPPVGFISGLVPFVFLPLWRWFFSLFRRNDIDNQRQYLTDALKNGGSAIVFLRRPSLRESTGGRPVKINGIRLSVESQEQLDLPVQILPTVFLWGEGAMKRMPGTMDFIFGSAEYPRLLRSIRLLIRRRSTHGSWIGEAIDLSAVRKNRKVDNASLTGIVKAGVGRCIEKIRRERLGSLTKPSSRLKYEVINSKRLRKELEIIAADDKITPSSIEPKVRTIINAMATNFRPGVITFIVIIFSFVWRRIYNGFDISDADREKLRAAVGQGPLLLLPTHKSHIDYLAVSQVLIDANIMLPHIAAGENLSFWPLGWFFRSSGAFFIRRKFINDRFYSAVVNSYIRRLMQSGYTIEVFIEGGRSRTGKLLRPKLGMLEMALKAYAVSPRINTGVLPIFLGYEKVIEEDAYVKESVGKKKRKESVSGILKTTKVLLHKYGHLTVRTGDYFTIETVLSDLGHNREDLNTGSIRRKVALEIAIRTLHEINQITVATPSALLSTAALTMPSPKFRWSTLRKNTSQLTEYLNAQGVEFGRIVKQWVSDNQQAPDAKHESLDKTINAFIKAGRIRIVAKGDDPLLEIKEECRLPLDYYKNNIIHFFVPLSIICATCLANKKKKTTLKEIYKDMTLACHLYRWEFLLPDASNDNALFNTELDAMLKPAVEILIQQGILQKHDDGLTVANVETAVLTREILRNFYEPYYATLHISRLRNFGEITGETTRLSRLYMEKSLNEQRFSRPEGLNRINMQNAFHACKDLRLNRPFAGHRPFDDNEMGDQLIKFVARALDLPDS